MKFGLETHNGYFNTFYIFYLLNLSTLDLADHLIHGGMDGISKDRVQNKKCSRFQTVPGTKGESKSLLMKKG